MGWRPKGTTPTKNMPRNAQGFGLNRECRHCLPPCTGGEVLHRRGHCCRSFCDCPGFEPVSTSTAPPSTGRKKSTLMERSWR